MPWDGLRETHESREANRNEDDLVPCSGPVPISQKQNEEEAVYWRFVSRPVCTSQPSSTLSLILPLGTFQVVKGKEKKPIIFLYISVVVVLPCMSQLFTCHKQDVTLV